MSNVNGRTLSEYYHRDKKHSATVHNKNGTFDKVKILFIGIMCPKKKREITTTLQYKYKSSIFINFLECLLTNVNVYPLAL
ncbi:hypothetical protein [Lactococcus allomyrinae]|uniref:hypothetical protein n=1 Tax=Lactococcus allomyrinae TaxID=2419773 RepID=UPI003B8469B6